MQTIKYDAFRYIWPPRPETTIQAFSEGAFTSHFNAMKDRPSWVAQLKLNGQRNSIYISPDGKLQMWNRHAEKHRNWQCPSWLSEQVLAALPGFNGKWMVLDGELLHNKDKTVKNTLYWWDILVFNNEQLTGTTYGTRQALLQQVTAPPTSDDGMIAKLSPNIWLARNIKPADYEAAWDQTKTGYVEGFVFKNLDGKLAPGLSEKNNSAWQVRCRKPHAGHAYVF